MTTNTFFFLATTGLVLRIIFSFLIPSFAGNDELAHLRYAQHILAERKLPNLNNYSTENPVGNEYFQPPLYYTLLTPLISFIQDPINQLKTGRLFSIFLWTVTFYFAYKILMVIKLPKSQSIITLSLVSLLPYYIFNSSSVTNDSLGFYPLYSSYFHSTILLPAALARFFRQKMYNFNKKTNKNGIHSDFRPLPKLLNSCLVLISSFEREILLRKSLPFGLSIVSISKKNGSKKI